MDKDKTRDLISLQEPWYYRSGPLAASLLIILLTIIIYVPAIKAPFVLDDEINIIRNARLHNFTGFWPPLGSRYLAYLSFALNYTVGGLNTFGYHLVNLVIHILSAMTLYGLVRSLFRTPAMGGRAEKGGDSALANHIALLTALIFTAHPLNTQAVIYITQRFTSMAALFYLLSLYLYLKWRLAEKGPFSLLFYVLSILTAIMAAKTKEISFTLPFVIVLAEYVFFTEPGRWINKKRLYYLIPYAIVLILIPLSILGPELGLWGLKRGADAGFTRIQQVIDLKELSPYSYLMTQFTVVPKYIKLLFIPFPLNLDYDYPLYHSFFSLKVMAGFVLLLFIFTVSLFTASFARRRHRPLLLIAMAGLLWFFITLSIESTVIPIRDVIFEHRMYLPGAGLALALSVLIVDILRRGKKQAFGRAVLITAIIITTPLTVIALGRALVWSDAVRLNEDIVRKSPNKARAHNNLGALYATKGQLDKAIIEFRKTIDIESDSSGPHKNLARALYGKGDISGAVREYKAAIRANPGAFEAHQALAFIYRGKGLYAESEKEYKIILSLVPWNIKARNNLANIYVVQERLMEAISEYKNILMRKPGYIEVYYNLGFALEKAGHTEEALYNYKKFLEAAPPKLRDTREQAKDRIKKLSLQER